MRKVTNISIININQGQLRIESNSYQDRLAFRSPCTQTVDKQEVQIIDVPMKHRSEWIRNLI